MAVYEPRKTKAGRAKITIIIETQDEATQKSLNQLAMNTAHLPFERVQDAHTKMRKRKN